MKNILITGGAGFIGSTIALRLLDRGYNVRVMDSLTEQIHGKDPVRSFLYSRIEGKVDFFRGDVTRKDDWMMALQGQDAAIHLAAETGTGQSMYQIQRYTDVNISGTALLLDILANSKTGIRKVIVAASRAIYGEGRYRCAQHGYVYPEPRKEEALLKGDFEVKCPQCGAEVELAATSEDSAIHPTSLYGITKQVQEQMVLLTCRSIGIPAVSYRYQNVYGPGQSLKNPYTGILSIFSTNMLAGSPINIFEDGKESRDFVYIEDVAHATILGLESDQADYQSLNVGCGKSVSVLEVAKTLKFQYASTSELSVSGNFRLGDIRHNYADIGKIRRLLGFEPQYRFEQGIGEFCAWVRAEKPVSDDSYRRSLEEMKQKGLFK